ncbi:MAG TPA: serine/threonine-protein kinase [Polyangiaceae bacterium]|nr:serine/threonine-protein kinase [Polyangiaceae bacterium]
MVTEASAKKSAHAGEEPVLDLGSGESLPRRFGRLTLLRRLARGGMGEVYLAATRGIEGAERPCVVKTIRQEHASDRSFRARFLDETRIQAQLQHPGVAQILEANTLEGDRPYAVVEYIEGRHLGEVLQRSNQLGVRIEWPDAVAIAVCFGDALGHVHERTDANGRALDIAHRDLSPQNVMLGYSGDLKLIDFGTARGENRRCRTVSGIVFAKPGYVAPEVANQTPGGAPADLYAFAVMLWELLAGRRFLSGDSVDHQARVATGELRLPPIAVACGGPARLDEILARASDPDVGQRTPSARRIVSELVELLKLAPSLADGDRSVRGRIALLMQKLYPAEPARSRADFARRVLHARELMGSDSAGAARPGVPEPSPAPAQAHDEPEGLLPGTRYRLLRCLSSGPMGEVWEAQHVDLGRTVALKLISDGVRGNGAARQRFRAEARAVARLDHPGLVKLHDFGVTADGRCYFGMEMLQGSTLEGRLAEGPMTWKTAVRVIIDAARALGAAHAAGIVHRDITPSNLFLTESGAVKVLDFGVASSQVEPRDENNHEAPLVVGTPEYISPEQAAGAVSDARSDLYALGVVLYEALTGRVPHPLGPEASATLPALLTAKITMVPAVPSSVVGTSGLPASLDAVVMRMLERDAERRFANSDELILALERTLEPPRRRAVPRSAWASAAAAFATVLALGWGLSSRDSAPTAPTAAVDLDGSAQGEAQGEAESGAKAAMANGAAPVAVAVAPAAVGASATGPVAGEAGADEAEAADAEANEPTPATTPEDDEIQAILALAARGQKIAAHHKMKVLVERRPEDPRVLAGLVVTAKGVKAWGEALDAATRRARLDESTESLMDLARLEKVTLHGDPAATLERLLARFPDYAPAKELLAELRAQASLSR